MYVNEVNVFKTDPQHVPPPFHSPGIPFYKDRHTSTSSNVLCTDRT